MVLDKKETTIAYRCPSCGSGVVSLVGAFSLSADMIRMRCSCGGSELTVQYKRDRRVRLTVPCLFCPTPHSFTLSGEMFFRRELTTLPCAYTGIEVCFIGAKDDVIDALSRSERELLEMLGDTDMSDLERVRKMSLSDPQVYDIVNFVVRDMQDEGKIHCRCEDGDGDYRVSIDDDAISVTCERCGASASFPADSVLSAHEFLISDSLNLE